MRADKILDEMKWIPAPFVTQEELDSTFDIAHNPEKLARVPVAHVAPDELQPTQIKLNPNQVQDFAKKGNFHDALIFQRGGTNYIIDGHHRTAAALSAKVPKIRVHLIKAD